MMHPVFRRRRKTHKAGRDAVKIPMQIIIRNLAHSEALEARVRESVTKLEGIHPNIVSCRVTVEESHRHQHQGRQFQVRIDARVPGKEFVASHDHDEYVYIALRDAVLAMRRQLEDAARVSRGEIKSHSQPKAEDSESAGDA